MQSQCTTNASHGQPPRLSKGQMFSRRCVGSFAFSSTILGPGLTNRLQQPQSACTVKLAIHLRETQSCCRSLTVSSRVLEVLFVGGEGNARKFAWRDSRRHGGRERRYGALHLSPSAAVAGSLKTCSIQREKSCRRTCSSISWGEQSARIAASSLRVSARFPVGKPRRVKTKARWGASATSMYLRRCLTCLVSRCTIRKRRGTPSPRSKSAASSIAKPLRVLLP